MVLYPLLSLAFYAAAALGAPPSGDGTQVTVAQGAVKGTLVSPTVRQWLGIPFAADTSGANRWKAPQAAPAIPSGTVFSATAFGNPCPQNVGPVNAALLGLLGMPANVPNQSENCLSLNVWSPSVDRKQKTAVLIWVYGGSFQFGESGIDVYNGQTFVQNNNDITLVTINYRVNIFGAPNAPQLLGGVQNFGLLDIEAAVNWVHDNIAAFGGDPNRISLFGESAGAIAVDAYTYSHPQDTKVKGIILESGTAGLSTQGATNPSSPTSPWNTVAKAVGCGTTDDAAQLSCMQGQSFAALEQASEAGNLGFSVLADGVTFFSDFGNRSANGQFLKVPVLIGNNANEGDIFVAAMEEVSKTPIPFPLTALSDLMTAAVFNCPASQSTANRVKAGVPTYRYRYDAVFPDLTNRTDLRAYHGSEIPIVFGTFRASPSPEAPTPDEIALSAYMQAAWVAFARNPASGLRGIGSGFNWPRYDPSQLGTIPTLVELGSASNTRGAHFTPPVLFDSSCFLATESFQLVEELLAVLGAGSLG